MVVFHNFRFIENSFSWSLNQGKDKDLEFDSMKLYNSIRRQFNLFAIC